MPIIKNEIPQDINIVFLYSSTLELVSSLHVISDPSHHSNCIGWYDDMMKSADSGLLEKIRIFGLRYAHWTFAMDLIDRLLPSDVSSPYPPDDFDLMMDKLLDLNRDEFVCIFLGATLLGDRNVANDIIKSWENLNKYDLSELYKYIKRDDAIYFLQHIEEIRLEMIQLMKEYYISYFKDHWETTSTFYKSALINEKKSFDRTLPLNFILSLHQDLSFENNTIYMKKETQFVVKTEEINEIRILFSMYTFPHLMINVYEGSISIYENLLIPNMSTIFDDVAASVKALGDSTRLAIIKVLLKNDLTNKSLARLVNITPASVSQHLKILKESDLLISNRQKNNIFYSINKERLSSLIAKLNHFLELEP